MHRHNACQSSSHWYFLIATYPTKALWALLQRAQSPPAPCKAHLSFIIRCGHPADACHSTDAGSLLSAADSRIARLLPQSRSSPAAARIGASITHAQIVFPQRNHATAPSVSKSASSNLQPRNHEGMLPSKAKKSRDLGFSYANALQVFPTRIFSSLVAAHTCAVVPLRAIPAALGACPHRWAPLAAAAGLPPGGGGTSAPAVTAPTPAASAPPTCHSPARHNLDSDDQGLCCTYYDAAF